MHKQQKAIDFNEMHSILHKYKSYNMNALGMPIDAGKMRNKQMHIQTLFLHMLSRIRCAYGNQQLIGVF